MFDYDISSFANTDENSLIFSPIPHTLKHILSFFSFFSGDNGIPFAFTNTTMTGEPAEKRSIGSLKNSPTHGKKVKRDISYDDLSDDAELLEPVFQNEPLNYDELRYAMNDMYPEYEKEIHSQKRYLGECH